MSAPTLPEGVEFGLEPLVVDSEAPLFVEALSLAPNAQQILDQLPPIPEGNDVSFVPIVTVEFEAGRLVVSAGHARIYDLGTDRETYVIVPRSDSDVPKSWVRPLPQEGVSWQMSEGIDAAHIASSLVKKILGLQDTVVSTPQT